MSQHLDYSFRNLLFPKTLNPHMSLQSGGNPCMIWPVRRWARLALGVYSVNQAILTYMLHQVANFLNTMTVSANNILYTQVLSWKLCMIERIWKAF